MFETLPQKAKAEMIAEEKRWVIACDRWGISLGVISLGHMEFWTYGIPVLATGTWMRRTIVSQRKGRILLLISAISEVFRTKE